MNAPWLDDILDGIIAAEGSAFTDHPADRGGPTRFGITLATLQTWHHAKGLPPATVADVRRLTERRAREIYTDRYVVAPHLDRIDDTLLRWQVVDAGVMSGPRRAVEWLQEVAGVKIDGHLGPITAARVASLSAHSLGIQFAARRIRFLGRLVTNDASQAAFIAGWTNRATAFLDREAARFREMPSR